MSESPVTANSGGVCIIGGGFTGLTTAWELLKSGIPATVIEAETTIGGLAAGFDASGSSLERFYHHWFTSDTHITGLVTELGLAEHLVARNSRTGMYYAQSLFRLSRPMDLLKFKPLPLIDRIRLGLMVPRARKVRDWRSLESRTAREWLIAMGGPTVYRVVWEPLLRGKFGDAADDISAVWLWNKLCLRGGSRNKKGDEVLLYYRGGFAALTQALSDAIVAKGGRVLTGVTAERIVVETDRAIAVETSGGRIACDQVVITTPLPIAADLLEPHVGQESAEKLRRIRYLANVCLILELSESLSDFYWINVNDPSFPFVGVIEHTNFESTAAYGDRHIVYLSRYLPAADAIYSLSDADYLAYALPYLKRMFPQFSETNILDYHVWRAEFAQPLVERNYSALIPDMRTSLRNVYLSSMAQIYPEDRGTNYAVRGGREVAALVKACISSA